MIAEVGSTPTDVSHICIDPPTPPQHPVALPIISPRTECGVRPKANASAWLLYVPAITSVGFKVVAIPNASAS